jgi:hypothetical protein
MRGNSHVRFGEEPRGNDPTRAPRRAAYSTPRLRRQPWQFIVILPGCVSERRKVPPTWENKGM